MTEDEEIVADISEDLMEHIEYMLVRGAELQHILDGMTAVMIYLVEMRDSSDADTLDMLHDLMTGRATKH
jgi:hypothetical protein